MLPSSAQEKLSEDIYEKLPNLGMGIKSVIESYTGKQLSTGLPTEDPQNPNYATSHPKQSYKEILFNAVKDAALQSCSATAANNVGICYQQHKKKHKGNETLEGYILHKGAHATIGATTAAIRKAKIEKKTDVNEIFHAAVSGATGAVVAEASAEYYQKHFTKKGQELIDSLEDKGIEPTQKNLQKAYNHNLKLSGSIGRLTAVTSAYLLDHDIEIANRAAQNAIDNNFLTTTQGEYYYIGDLGDEIEEAYNKGGEEAVVDLLLEKGCIKQNPKTGQYESYDLLTDYDGCIAPKGYNTKTNIFKALLKKDPQLYCLIHRVIPLKQKMEQEKATNNSLTSQTEKEYQALITDLQKSEHANNQGKEQGFFSNLSEEARKKLDLFLGLDIEQRKITKKS